MKQIAKEVIEYIAYLIAFAVWLIPVIMLIVMEG
jgi:hypothetical protein